MLAEYGGLSKVMPWFAVIFMIMTPVVDRHAADPGKRIHRASGRSLVGAFGARSKVWAILGATGLVLGAAYMLWLYQRTMFGQDRHTRTTAS